MSENIIYVPGRIRNAADGGYTTGAIDIIDDAKGKSQQVVNQETDAALEDRYTKGETYNKTELNNLITTPDQQYVTLTAQSGDTLEDIFDGVTGAADTVYRVGSWDGSAYNVGAYCEYAWDGTNFVPLDKKEPGIDDKPTAGSKNIIESNAVHHYSSIIDNNILARTDILSATGTTYDSKRILIDYPVFGGNKLHIKVNSISSEGSTSQSSVYVREKHADGTYKDAVNYKEDDDVIVTLDATTVSIDVTLYISKGTASTSEVLYTFDYLIEYDCGILDSIKKHESNINNLQTDVSSFDAKINSNSGNIKSIDKALFNTIIESYGQVVGNGEAYAHVLLNTVNVEGGKNITITVGDIVSLESTTNCRLFVVEKANGTTVTSNYLTANSIKDLKLSDNSDVLEISLYASLSTASVNNAIYKLDFYRIDYSDNAINNVLQIPSLKANLDTIYNDYYSFLYKQVDKVAGTGVQYQKNTIVYTPSAGIRKLGVEIGDVTKGDVRIQEWDVYIDNAASLPAVSHRIAETTFAKNTKSGLTLNANTKSITIVENLGASATVVGTEYTFDVFIYGSENVSSSVHKDVNGVLYDNHVSVNGKDGDIYHKVVVFEHLPIDTKLCPLILEVGDIDSTADVTKSAVEVITYVGNTGTSHYCSANSSIKIDVTEDVTDITLRVFPARAAASYTASVYNFRSIRILYDNCIKNAVERLNAYGNNYVPDYWKTELDTSIASIKENIEAATKRQVTFAFVTDVHYPYNYKMSPSLISYLTKNISIDEVICGGDIIHNYAATKAEALDIMYEYENAMRSLTPVVLRGNHDDNHASAAGASGAVSKDLFYDIFTKPQEKVTDTNTEIYFSINNQSQKFRYIFLDTDNNSMSSTQVNWLKNQLTSLETGWTCVIMCHFYFNAASSASAETLSVSDVGTQINNAIDEVFDNMNGTIAAIICGHTHRDYDIQSSHNYPIIAVTTDSNGTNANLDPITPNRVQGTITEQAFDIFTIGNGKIEAVRVGAGNDRSFTY